MVLAVSLISFPLCHLLSNSCLLSLTAISVFAIGESISWMHLSLAAGNYNLPLCVSFHGQGAGNRVYKLIVRLKIYSFSGSSQKYFSLHMVYREYSLNVRFHTRVRMTAGWLNLWLAGENDRGEDVCFLMRLRNEKTLCHSQSLAFKGFSLMPLWFPDLSTFTLFVLPWPSF